MILKRSFFLSASDLKVHAENRPGSRVQEYVYVCIYAAFDMIDLHTQHIWYI